MKRQSERGTGDGEHYKERQTKGLPATDLGKKMNMMKTISYTWTQLAGETGTGQGKLGKRSLVEDFPRSGLFESRG